MTHTWECASCGDEVLETRNYNKAIFAKLEALELVCDDCIEHGGRCSICGNRDTAVTA